MKLKTHTYVTPRNNEKARVWKEASRNCTLQRIFCFRLCDTMGSLKSRISPNIIIQIHLMKANRFKFPDDFKLSDVIHPTTFASNIARGDQ